MSRHHGILLITTLSVAVGTPACMGHHPFLGLCGLSIDPAHCNLIQGPVSIRSAADSEVPISVRDVQNGRSVGRAVSAAKNSSFLVGVGGALFLRINGKIQYFDEVDWHSSDKRVATVEWWSATQARVVGKRAGIATISVNVSGQRDSVTVTVSDNPVPH
jgi:hypothetical protein